MSPRATPLLLVAGLHPMQVSRAATSLLDVGGTVVVHHDVRHMDQGVVIRTIREHAATGPVVDRSAVELAHGCVSCTLRLDVLPLLRTLAQRPDVSRIVLQLDPALEPEHLCFAIDAVVLDGGGTAGDHVRVHAVLAVLDADSWLADASGEESMADRGLAATADDERTVAQVVIAQTGFADGVLLSGRPEDGWTAARTEAVLDRLLPGAPRANLATSSPDELLVALPATARRGKVRMPHDPALAGQPPLTEDAGVSLVRFSGDRPFHPERLHEAFDTVLDGVVCSRGVLWLATQQDRGVWLESAGGGLQVGDAGPWLATLDDDRELWEQVDPARRVAAALRWDPVHGDRHTEVVVLSHRQPAGLITAALHDALLTDDELALGPDGWARFADPFGEWHEDPCEASSPADDPRITHSEEN